MKYVKLLFATAASVAVTIVCMTPIAYLLFESFFSLFSCRRDTNMWYLYLMIFAHLTGVACIMYIPCKCVVGTIRLSKQVFCMKTGPSATSAHRRPFVCAVVAASCFLSSICLLIERRFFIFGNAVDYGVAYEEDFLHLIAVACCTWVACKNAIKLFDIINGYDDTCGDGTDEA